MEPARPHKTPLYPGSTPGRDFKEKAMTKKKTNGLEDSGDWRRRARKVARRCTECGALVAAEECLACYLRDPYRYEFDAEYYAGVFSTTSQKKKLTKTPTSR